MLKTWDIVKHKVHDASGISTPSDWLWKKDYRCGIYYPDSKIVPEISSISTSAFAKKSRNIKVIFNLCF
jgi:hypothetical protein